jgi:predicted lipoprotein with Yx(FWY)xxD motif
MHSRIMIGLTSLAMLGASSLAVAQDHSDGKLALSAKEAFGEYVTDGKGRALYLFEKDKNSLSRCYEKCAEVWPPFVVSTNKIRAEDVDKALIGMIERKDGRLQVTYDGRPLYYYIKDQKRPGSTKGHDVHDDFGEWYLVAPSGKKVAAPAQPPSETQGLGAGEGTEQQPSQGTQDY